MAIKKNIDVHSNIKAMQINIPKLGEAKIYGYKYDQLNRLTAMDAYEGLNNGTNVFTPIDINGAYKERISYDANGNIQTYLRKDANGSDKNNYQYTYATGTNRLSSIFNTVNSQTKTYSYDAIGNTTADGMQGVTAIDWNVYGKVRSLTNGASEGVSYTYGADGQRIGKTVGNIKEWYVRDASGNIMATYTKDATINGGDLTVSEQYKYGSSLLSVKDAKINVENPVNTITTAFDRGNDNYILADANGNTKVTVSDRRTQHSSDGIHVDYYTANTVTATFHSAFGANAKIYNGGFAQANFNGQRKSLEIGADAQTALYWEYNGDVERRWNLDPKPTTGISPYATFFNNPIWYSDKLGDTVRGVSKADAEYLQTDIKESLAGGNFKKVRDLIKIDKDKVSISTISQDALNKAIEGITLSNDEKALLNSVVNTINSKQVHYAEYKDKNEWISDFGINAMKVDVSYYTKSIVKGITGMSDEEIEPDKVPANAFFLLKGAVTSEYNGGSYSLIPKTYAPGPKNDYYNTKGKPTTNPLKRPTLHEVFGHGRMLALKITDQHTQIIQFENLVLRVMKKDIYRDGTNHDNGTKVRNYEDIPEFVNQKE